MLDYNALNDLGKLDFEPVVIEGLNLEQLSDVYDRLLIQAYCKTQNSSIADRKFATMLDWLHSTDFYVAPASSAYHESFPGGLLVHSLNVYNELLSLLRVSCFDTHVKAADAVVAALVHDWCKIDFYESYEKNVKDDVTGQWHKEPAYRINQRGVPLGHGTTSLFLASRVMRLTTDQCLAIRWHMGEYNVAPNEVNELQKANEICPMCYLIQFADRLACTNYAKEVK